MQFLLLQVYTAAEHRAMPVRIGQDLFVTLPPYPTLP